MTMLVFSLLPVDANAKVKKKQHKSSERTIKSAWVEVARNDKEIWYLNTKNVDLDLDGNPLVTIKVVPTKGTLEAVRREHFNNYKNSKFKKFTHTIKQFEVDIFGSRLKLINVMLFAGNKLLDLDIAALHSQDDWFYCPPNSMGGKLINAIP